MDRGFFHRPAHVYLKDDPRALEKSKRSVVACPVDAVGSGLAYTVAQVFCFLADLCLTVLAVTERGIGVSD